MKYYYPENLEAPAVLLLWTQTNCFIIMTAYVFALLFAGFLYFVLPLLFVTLYTILTAQFDGISILRYSVKIGSYLLSKQQRYFWEVKK